VIAAAGEQIRRPHVRAGIIVQSSLSGMQAGRLLLVLTGLMVRCRPAASRSTDVAAADVVP